MGSSIDSQGGVGVVDYVVAGNDKFIKIFNDTGGALSDGDIVAIDFLKDTTTTNGTNQPTVSTPADTAVLIQLGVVNTFLLNKTTIADDEWGYVQTAGYCPKITCTTADAVVKEDYLSLLTSTKTAFSAAFSSDSFAIAKSAKG